MGGNAFLHAAADGQPTLRTPRMSPSKYTALKSQYIRALRNYFPGCEVVALKEAPEKPDYGDIDLLVCTNDTLDPMHFGDFLGAAGIIAGGGHRCSVAVPLDASRHPQAPAFYKAYTGSRSKKVPSTGIAEKDFVQIDIELVQPHSFGWHTFYSSYGDLSGLLGAIMHNLGFTVSDRGLFLRLQELDDAKKTPGVRVDNREGLLFLSKEPEEVMRFLRVSPERYKAGFETMHEFYHWLAESRFVTLEARQLSKRKNNSKQRQKDTKRTIIGNFFEEFLPEYLGVDSQDSEGDSPVEGDVSWPPAGLVKLRQQYAQEAVQFFGREEEFNKQHTALVGWIESQKAEQLLKPVVAHHSGKKEKKLAELIRAFRRRVRFSAKGEPYITDVAHEDQQSELHGWLADDSLSLRDPDAVSSWVRDHWEKLKDLERRGSEE